MSATFETMDYKSLTYNINRVSGFEFPLAVSIWKAQHKTFDNFERVTRGNYEGTEFDNFFNVIAEAWDDAEELTTLQAFSTPNIEHRRVIFNAIGVDNIMAKLEPELVDTKTIVRKNLTYNEQGIIGEVELVDTYELYKIDGSKLFTGTTAGERWSRLRNDQHVYAVKCKDASTDREYWIYVQADAAKNNDALEAIAWTYQMKTSVYTNSIYRQGEVIIAKHDGDEPAPGKRRWGQFYHLDKEDYLTKIKAQS